MEVVSKGSIRGRPWKCQGTSIHTQRKELLQVSVLKVLSPWGRCPVDLRSFWPCSYLPLWAPELLQQGK